MPSYLHPRRETSLRLGAAACQREQAKRALYRDQAARNGFRFNTQIPGTRLVTQAAGMRVVRFANFWLRRAMCSDHEAGSAQLKMKAPTLRVRRRLEVALAAGRPRASGQVNRRGGLTLGWCARCLSSGFAVFRVWRVNEPNRVLERRCLSQSPGSRLAESTVRDIPLRALSASRRMDPNSLVYDTLWART